MNAIPGNVIFDKMLDRVARHNLSHQLLMRLGELCLQPQRLSHTPRRLPILVSVFSFSFLHLLNPFLLLNPTHRRSRKDVPATQPRIPRWIFRAQHKLSSCPSTTVHMYSVLPVVFRIVKLSLCQLMPTMLPIRPLHLLFYLICQVPKVPIVFAPHIMGELVTQGLPDHFIIPVSVVCVCPQPQFNYLATVSVQAQRS